MKSLITEIFSSIQGEGLFVGERQIFVRFAGCNLKCDYCDTGKSHRVSESTPARQLLLGGSQRVIEKIKILNPGKIHSVSLTGGEPLLYVGFLQGLLPQIKKLGLKTYLETNGTLPEELKKVIKWIDYVAMDIKLPSAGNPACWGAHREFLEVLYDSRMIPGEYFVKIVLTSKTTAAEIKKATDTITSVSSGIPLVLQPVTPIRDVKKVSPKNTFTFQDQAMDHLATVKVIPQMHKILGVR